MEWSAISSSKVSFPGIEHTFLSSPALAGGFFTTGETHRMTVGKKFIPPLQESEKSSRNLHREKYLNLEINISKHCRVMEIQKLYESP